MKKYNQNCKYSTNLIIFHIKIIQAERRIHPNQHSFQVNQRFRTGGNFSSNICGLVRQFVQRTDQLLLQKLIAWQPLDGLQHQTGNAQFVAQHDFALIEIIDVLHIDRLCSFTMHRIEYVQIKLIALYEEGKQIFS